MSKMTSIYLLSGFLGSGKTTLLTGMMEYWNTQGIKAAVLMNELGEVNLDGVVVGQDVPMKELLSGCICCTVRGDFGYQLHELMEEHEPDVVLVESTGVANPMEVLDELAELSLYKPIELKGVITVVDAYHLSELLAKGKGPTFRLMQDQIRCASLLILNKTDLVNLEDVERVREALEDWNKRAPIIPAIRCQIDPALLIGNTVLQNKEATEDSRESDGSVHGHHHMLVYTHPLTGPVDSYAFEAFLQALPPEIHRAKGIVTFSDTASRYLFQFAYRQAEFTKINPQGEIGDVAVFIGEPFSKEQLQSKLNSM
ncbi:cobalamin biosynthesis protein [Paenibacillus swuensis]|uniref:Cobalamin biosynthesis protein n=1 Tax=Paenibacillus swuensis TaxID=1178515 RepID=A0A172TMD5_9BACL|nr:GTP-binding protein [Paenibacillus swuensis]ANE48126.1 cobalamin biosynthesis protein [Paenibacillus swuensis]